MCFVVNVAMLWCFVSRLIFKATTLHTNTSRQRWFGQNLQTLVYECGVTTILRQKSGICETCMRLRRTVRRYATRQLFVRATEYILKKWSAYLTKLDKNSVYIYHIYIWRVSIIIDMYVQYVPNFKTLCTVVQPDSQSGCTATTLVNTPAMQE